LSIFVRLTQQPAREPFLLCLALIGLGLGIGALAGSSLYRQRLPRSIQGFLALLLSQMAALFLLPAVQGANFLPHLLPAYAAASAQIIGDAMALVFALPLSVQLCFLLVPKGGPGRRLGIVSFLLSALMTAVFLIAALLQQEQITALFYGGSLLLGTLTLIGTISRPEYGPHRAGQARKRPSIGKNPDGSNPFA